MDMDPRIPAWLRRLKTDPMGAMENARNNHVDDLVALTNLWDRVPDECPPGQVLDVLLHHLVDFQPPTRRNQGDPESPDRAFLCLTGLSKLGPFLDLDPSISPRIRRAWQSIWAWMCLMFTASVRPGGQTPEHAKATWDIVAAVLYAFAQDDVTRVVIAATPGSLEMATQLWIREDKGAVPSMVDLPAGSCALGLLLKFSDQDSIERVLNGTNYKPEEIAKIALTRLRLATTKRPLNDTHLTIYMDFINSMCRVPKHPMRHAFIANNVINQMTKTLLAVSTEPLANPNRLEVIASGFGFLHNVLESLDGCSLVRQAVRAGLIVAFLDCSPAFARLDQEDCGFALGVFKKIVPRYMVYCTVIEAIDQTMRKTDFEGKSEKITNSVAEDVWAAFYQLAMEHTLLVVRTKANVDATCDNMKCQKVDSKKNFKECAACLTTFYCSKECQKTAWQEGDHRLMCKLKQQERMEGRGEAVTKKDAQFFHKISMRDARRHLPHLRKLAERDHSNLKHEELVVAINYTKVPPVYSLKPLKKYKTGNTDDTMNANARNDAIIKKVRENPTKFTLIESTIANGDGWQIVMTLSSGGFWASDRSLLGGGRPHEQTSADDHLYEEDDLQDDLLDEGGGVAADEVDIMMGRMMINRFLAAHRESAAS